MDRTLPPVTLTPEEAAAAAVALALQPGGPYQEVARAALDKVLAALDPEGREEIVRLVERVQGGPRAVPVRPRRSAAHPAGRGRTGAHERLAPVIHLRSVR